MRRIAALCCLLPLLAGCAGSISLGEPPARQPTCPAENAQSSDELNPGVVLIAQSVPSASWLPCINPLPVGFRYERLEATNHGTHLWLKSGGEGNDEVEVLLSQACDLRGTQETRTAPTGMRRYQRVDDLGSVYRGKINGWWTNIHLRSDFYPGTKKTRGYNGLKEVLGYVYGLDIKYFVEVNFDGFKQVINELGGVTVNVQVPIVDDSFPSSDGRHVRLYIPSGLQHMDGNDALQYARSRHTTTDWDRSARQQRLLLAMRQQADPQQLIPKLPDLVKALKGAVKTDIPVDQFDELLGLASQIDTANISSYVFQPPLYGSEVLSPIYKSYPNVPRIRAAVNNAFKRNPIDEAQAEALASEAAQIWVLNPYADPTRGSDLAGYLEYRGLAASAPRQKPPGSVLPHTKIVVYNGAESKLTDTIAFLEKTFKVTVETKTDPAMRADIVVTIGGDTPRLTAPPLS
jgi:LCP family protein required for cell wall assembly